MDDILVLRPTRWKLRRAVTALNAVLGSLRLEKRERPPGAGGGTRTPTALPFKRLHPRMSPVCKRRRARSFAKRRSVAPTPSEEADAGDPDTEEGEGGRFRDSKSVFNDEITLGNG